MLELLLLNIEVYKINLNSIRCKLKVKNVGEDVVFIFIFIIFGWLVRCRLNKKIFLFNRS